MSAILISERETERVVASLSAATYGGIGFVDELPVGRVPSYYWFSPKSPDFPATIRALTAEQARPEWRAAVETQLAELGRLPDGWDTYQAPPIDPDVLAEAARFVELIEPRFPPPSVVPTINGTVQLEWHTRRFDLEIEILNAEKYWVASAVPGGEITESQVGRSAATSLIAALLQASEAR